MNAIRCLILLAMLSPAGCVPSNNLREPSAARGTNAEAVPAETESVSMRPNLPPLDPDSIDGTNYRQELESCHQRLMMNKSTAGINTRPAFAEAK